ncbi:hypothetical protein GCM10009663_74140 [Kitasatospora arboriphila]|uniref:Uncharacterized protein n=1 Tax=Kitasatospora arboriphila TaxID=258052 RepID=A0ABN1U858_9ACTN
MGRGSVGQAEADLADFAVAAAAGQHLDDGLRFGDPVDPRGGSGGGRVEPAGDRGGDLLSLRSGQARVVTS